VRTARFRTKLVEGHKGVVAAIVPFDPESVWGLKPHRLAGRRHGWPVKGRIGRKAWAGYIGDRWGHFFITVDAKVLGLKPGDAISVVLSPARDAKTLARAVEQSLLTTQPKKARADAQV
jgi:hypothetical protein